MTLEDALAVPRVLIDANGGKPYPPVETAIALGRSPRSSYFGQVVSASLKYGLTKGNSRAERISLEGLGRRAAQPTSEQEGAEAITAAVLLPATFRAMYDHFKGQKVPEARFLTNTVVREFGVAPDDAEVCIDVFLKNMEFAGLIRVAPTGRFLTAEPGAAASTPAEADAQTAEGAPTPDPQHEDHGEIPPAPPTESESPTEDPKERRVFITHGKRSEVVVKQLKEILGFGDFEPIVAAERETTAKPVPLKVMSDMRSCGAAIIHVSGEKKVLDQDGNELLMLNENVLIEIGAAMALYGDKFILLVEDGVQLPSNLQGLYVAPYTGKALDQPATMKLLKAFKEFREQKQ